MKLKKKSEGEKGEKETPKEVKEIRKQRSFLSRLNPLNVLLPPSPPATGLWFRAEPLSGAMEGRLLDSKEGRYTVGGEKGEWAAAVHIVEKDGMATYVVNEPELRKAGKPGLVDEERVYVALMEEITRSMRPEERLDSPAHVEAAMWRAARDLGLVDMTKQAMAKYRYYIGKNLFGYWQLHVPMLDPNVEEISVTHRVAYVRHRKFPQYRWMATNIRFDSEEDFNTFCQRLAQKCGKTVSTAFPIGDGATPEGHRIAVTYGKEVSGGSCLDIRKRPDAPLSLAELVGQHMLSPLMAAYLAVGAREKLFPLFIGGMGTGKTTLVNALLSTLPETAKIITIEDTAELYLPHKNWTPLYTRVGTSLEKRFDVDYSKLTKIALRHRGDYIVVGESRKEETRDLFDAVATGHGGISSFHAGSMEELVFRLNQLGLMDDALQNIWAVPLIKQIAAGGERRVTEIYEVQGGGKFGYEPIFEWDPRTDKYAPANINAVVKGSKRLRDAYERIGKTPRDLAGDLESFASAIKTLVKEKRTSYEEFLQQLRKMGW